MRFGQAIDEVTKYGKLMRRACWEDSHHVGFRLPDGRSDMTGAYFYQSIIYPEAGGLELVIPWSPDVFDMTAHDWMVFDDEK